MVQWFDIVLLIVLTVISPIFGGLHHRRVTRQVAAGIPFVRSKSYGWTMAVEWGLVALVIPLWLTAGRTLPELGLAAQPSWRFWLGLVATLGAIAALFWQTKNFRQEPDKWDDLHKQVEGLEFMMPHDKRELAAFSWLSVTAGICEEIIYRGHLIWFLTAVSGSWIAFFGSSLIFALGHSYQGIRGMARVFVIGLVMAALYLLTGSLWAPILLHIAIDLTSGQMVHTILSSRRDGDEGSLPAVAATAG